MSRPVVLQSEDLNERPAAWIAERCELVRCRFDAGPAFARELARADALVVRTYTPVNSGTLSGAPRLRVVGRAGVGLDNIDVAACRARGVEVVHTPDANSQAVVEYVFALLFDALRPRRHLDRALDRDAWCAARRELSARRQLSECTLGVLGLGRIGARVARVGGAFGCRVIYHDLRDIPEAERAGASPVPPEELWRRSDIVSLHVDGREGNRGLVNSRVLGHARPDVTIVNTCRGMIVDTPALASFLREHPGACALVDVHDPEPFGPAYPLLGLPNARVLPHLAASTEGAHEAMGWVVRDVWRVLSGEPPRFAAP